MEDKIFNDLAAKAIADALRPIERVEKLMEVIPDADDQDRARLYALLSDVAFGRMVAITYMNTTMRTDQVGYVVDQLMAARRDTLVEMIADALTHFEQMPGFNPKTKRRAEPE